MAVLIAFAVYTQKSPGLIKSDATATATSIPAPLANVKVESTRLVKYEDPEGQPISLRMGVDFNFWNIDQNSDVKADAGKVMQVITGLQSLQPVSKLESTKDEAAMGIGADSKKITLVDESGSSIEIVLGDKTPTGSGYYIKVADSIYIVNTYSLEAVTGLLTMDEMIKKTETPTLEVTGTAEP